MRKFEYQDGMLIVEMDDEGNDLRITYKEINSKQITDNERVFLEFNEGPTTGLIKFEVLGAGEVNGYSCSEEE